MDIVVRLVSKRMMFTRAERKGERSERTQEVE